MRPAQRISLAQDYCPEPGWLQEIRKSFPLIAMRRGCDRSLSFSEGAVTCPKRPYFNPTRPIIPAGACPLHVRAVVIFLVRTPRRTVYCLPLLLQFTKRRIRTF